jgi:hypothetical protein
MNSPDPETRWAALTARAREDRAPATDPNATLRALRQLDTPPALGWLAAFDAFFGSGRTASASLAAAVAAVALVSWQAWEWWETLPWAELFSAGGLT